MLSVERSIPTSSRETLRSTLRVTSWSPGRLVIVGLPLLVGIIVALPTVLLMANSFNAAEAGQQATFGFKNWTDAFGSSATVSSLWNSLGLAVVRTAISMPLGIALTWLVTRTDMPGRAGIELLSWLSIFTPILPLTLGWIMLLDPKFGLINAGLAHLPFMHGKAFNVYSFWGITWVHLASSAIAFKVVLLRPPSGASRPARSRRRAYAAQAWSSRWSRSRCRCLRRRSCW